MPDTPTTTTPEERAELLELAKEVGRLTSQRDELFILYRAANEKVLEMREKLSRQVELVEALEWFIEVDAVHLWLVELHDGDNGDTNPWGLFFHLNAILTTSIENLDVARARLAELEGDNEQA